MVHNILLELHILSLDFQCIVTFVQLSSYHTQWTAESFVFGAVSLFFLCVKYLGNRWMDLCHIHM